MVKKRDRPGPTNPLVCSSAYTLVKDHRTEVETGNVQAVLAVKSIVYRGVSEAESNLPMNILKTLWE